MKLETKMLIPAATVLLIRDGEDGLEVFMVKRHKNIDFAGGALVFPGGKLDITDSDPDIRQFCTVRDELTGEQLAMRIGGIRETFEESGVLLAREDGSDTFLNGEHSAALQPYRDRLNDGEITMKEIAAQENIKYACDIMQPFAHWITPPAFHKQFDTRFYVVRSPGEQLASHDEGETTDSLWIKPQQALEDAVEKRRIVVFATRANLTKLGESADCGSALVTARETKITTIMPVPEETEGGSIFRIPEEAGYGFTEMFIPGALK